MDQKYGEFIGVDSLYYALITANTETAYTPGTPKRLAPVAEIAAEPEISNKTTYYDNSAASNYVTEGKTEVKITISNLDAKTLAEILGKVYDTTNGIVWDGGKANPPEIAIGFRYNMGQHGYRYYWYHVGTFSGGAEEATTMSNRREDLHPHVYGCYDSEGIHSWWEVYSPQTGIRRYCRIHVRSGGLVYDSQGTGSSVRKGAVHSALIPKSNLKAEMIMKPVFIEFTDGQGKVTRRFTTCSLKTGMLDNIFDIAEKAQSYENGEMNLKQAREFLRELKALIVAVFQGQFTFDELNAGAEQEEIVKVFSQICSNLKGDMAKN